MKSKIWRYSAGLFFSCALILGCMAYLTQVNAAESQQAASSSAEELQDSALSALTDEFGIIESSTWATVYPNQYNTYLENAKNAPGEYQEFLEAGGVDTTSVGTDKVTDFSSNKANYLDEDHYPEIKTLGKGYGYAKYYTEPAGHVYSLWSVKNNGRLGPLETSKGTVGCFACKTPQIFRDAEASGDPLYWTRSIQDYADDYFTENISCYNCHGNDPTDLRVERKQWTRALGDDAETVPLQGQVCGQCHCDYSMAPAQVDDEEKNVHFLKGEPTSPYYGGLDSMTPENALAFYDEYGFADWTYRSTGAKMLSVRHAEFEFCYANGGNFMVKNMGYNCNDCHMPRETDAEGTEYTSHFWTSPLDNPELLEKCNVCHGDLTTYVHELQQDIDGQTHLLGLRAEQFIFNFEAKVAIEKDVDGNTALTFDMDTAKANGLSEEDVAQLQKLQREACYYWNFAAAENSEGAHNPTFYRELIQKGNELLDEADKILGTSSVVDESVLDGWGQAAETASSAADGKAAA